MKREDIASLRHGAIGILGTVLLSRLDESVGAELADYSSHEIEIMIATLEDERAERQSARVRATLRERTHRPRPSTPTKVRMSYGSSSAVGEFQALLALPICPVCWIWGGVTPKRQGRPLCANHFPQKPRFQCKGCKRVFDDETAACCDEVRRMFHRSPAHLKGCGEKGCDRSCGICRPQLARWQWAQLVQRGIDYLDTCLTVLGINERELYEIVRVLTSRAPELVAEVDATPKLNDPNDLSELEAALAQMLGVS